jgi:dimethylhistidine N-methyltransferase
MNLHVRAPAPRPSRPPADAQDRAAFMADVVAGLGQPQKSLPAKYFYDRRGSELFAAITALPEYYPTRSEIAILRAHAVEMAADVPAPAALIEFGAGAAEKARILLAAAPHIATYVPVDISAQFLAEEAARLTRDLPRLDVLPVAADFTRPFHVPPALAGMARIGFFPGSTLGNFEPHDAAAFLDGAARLLGPGARLIIGIDLVKDVAILRAAYNDAAGVTAAFNLNMLKRIDDELGGDFDLDAFSHCAFYDPDKRRIEMHLVSRQRQRVRVAGKMFEFRRGETIHTENSYKYTIDSFRVLAAGSGWTSAAVWTDPDRYFSVHLLIQHAR